MIVRTQIQLNPADLAGETTGFRGIFRRHGGTRFVADIRGFVGGENKSLSSFYPTRTHWLTVVVEGDISPPS